MIIAPQGLDYIVAFLGALQAGSDPGSALGPDGWRHRRAGQSVLRDASPTVVLTTSSVVADVAEYQSAARESAAVRRRG